MTTGPEPGANQAPDPAAQPDSEWARPTQQPYPYQPYPTQQPYPYSTPQPYGWADPPPTRRSRGIIIAVVSVVVVALVACSGLVGGLFLLRSSEIDVADPATKRPSYPTAGASPRAGAEPTEGAEPEQQGPEASAYPAEQIADLKRVCDENIYYPQSPKRAGKPPHPVVLLIAEESGYRTQNRSYYYSVGSAKKLEAVWASEDARKVRMVACLDRVSTGSKIRGCEYDDPKPETLTLLRAGWRLRVYEVATGRKLLDKAMTGDDKKCPYVVLVGPDRKIYAGVSDRALVVALRGLVNK